LYTEYQEHYRGRLEQKNFLYTIDHINTYQFMQAAALIVFNGDAVVCELD